MLAYVVCGAEKPVGGAGAADTTGRKGCELDVTERGANVVKPP